MAKVMIARPTQVDDYDGRNDADTLMRAEEVKSDRARHKIAKKHLVKIQKKASKALGVKLKPHRFSRESVVSRKDME